MLTSIPSSIPLVVSSSPPYYVMYRNVRHDGDRLFLLSVFPSRSLCATQELQAACAVRLQKMLKIVRFVRCGAVLW